MTKQQQKKLVNIKRYLRVKTSLLAQALEQDDITGIINHSGDIGKYNNDLLVIYNRIYQENYKTK